VDGHEAGTRGRWSRDVNGWAEQNPLRHPAEQVECPF
jgi:hypothetical protein